MSFLRNYLAYCSGNEASESYHLWSGLVALSSIVGRRVWINQGYYNTYANLYVVLVGGAGNRKTTAMTVAKKLMRQVGGIPFSAEAMSKEGLVKQMADNESTFLYQGIPKSYCPLTVCVTELKEFVGTSNEKMINTLTTIYDQDFYDYRTRNKEDIIINNPYLTILACETPEWITLRLRDDVISGGFSRRTLFVFEMARRKRIAFPEVTPEAEVAWEAAKQRAKELLDIVGEFTWDPDAREFFKTWYETMHIPPDNNLKGYYETKHVQLLKVAMLIAVSEASDLVMRTEYLKTGLAFLEQIEINLSRVFEGMGRNELNAVSSKIMDVLTAYADAITVKELRVVMWNYANGRDFDQAVDHLFQAEKVTMWKDEGKGFICKKGCEPPAVRQALSRVGGTAPASLPSDGPPSEQSSTPGDLTDQFLLNQQTSPTPSGEGEVKPQSDGQPPETSEPTPPSQ